MMKKIATTIFCFGLFYAFCVASSDQYERDKESELRVSEFWTASGDKHFSGSGE